MVFELYINEIDEESDFNGALNTIIKFKQIRFFIARNANIMVVSPAPF